jgi:hypothetical protein
VGIPNCAIIAKYDTTDVANAIFPVPSGKRIREIYGNVISGKMNEDIVRIVFIMKFFFRFFCPINSILINVPALSKLVFML